MAARNRDGIYAWPNLCLGRLRYTSTRPQSHIWNLLWHKCSLCEYELSYFSKNKLGGDPRVIFELLRDNMMVLRYLLWWLIRIVKKLPKFKGFWCYFLHWKPGILGVNLSFAGDLFFAIFILLKNAILNNRHFVMALPNQATLMSYYWPEFRITHYLERQSTLLRISKY